MRLTVTLVAGAVFLAGCAASVISSSPRTVVIRSQTGITEAQPLAEAECKAQGGRHARYYGTGRAMTELIFDCIL